jgi:peptidoglycan/xylan/chitin deacetylase (PgdA/CDA1 family)
MITLWLTLLLIRQLFICVSAMNRYLLMKYVFKALEMLKTHHWLSGLTRGRGVIFTLHHVRPWKEIAFAPNRLLEITPEFLDHVLYAVREAGFEIITLDEAVARLQNQSVFHDTKPFAVFTSDDGYKDNRDFAQPLFQKHSAPWTMFITSGFAEGSAPLWWLDLQEVASKKDELTWRDAEGQDHHHVSRTPQEKQFAANELYWSLRKGPEDHLRKTVAQMCAEVGGEPLKRTRELCLSWPELLQMAQDPLITFGAHTLTHLMLAKQIPETVQLEMSMSKTRLETELQRSVSHFAYPVGDPTSAGVREFEMAKECGFVSALTTRPGHIFAEHAHHLHALPRVSLNGLFQSPEAIHGMLSGLPFAIWNKGSRINVD